jgi:3-hydroxybutyryl-CoA dehydrogenase
MRIVILANEEQKKVLGLAGDELVFTDDQREVSLHQDADAYIDLLFTADRDRIQVLKSLLPKPVLINSVEHTLAESDAQFIRINAWPTFLEGSLMESSAADNRKEKAIAVFTALGKIPEWVPDITGMITPRIICSIINEAFFALQEKISTAEEINTAMKLGTNYPYGPFEWAEKIGKKNVAALLQKLSREQKRYTPCSLLLE